MLNYQNNYVGCSSMMIILQNFDILARFSTIIFKSVSNFYILQQKKIILSVYIAIVNVQEKTKHERMVFMLRAD